MRSAGFSQNLEQFLAQKERLTFVTFDPTNQPTPDPLQSDLAWIWAVLWSAVAMIAAVLAAHLLNGAFPFFTLTFLVVPLIAILRERDARRVGMRFITLRDCFLVSLMALGALTVITLPFEPWSHTGQLLYHLALSSPASDATFLWLKQVPGIPGWLATALYSGMVTLFAEELFFRGWLQQGLLRRLPQVWAILIQATVFTVLVNLLVALAMPPLQASIYLIVYSWLGVGIVNGWAAARTRSIWPGLIVSALGLLWGMLNARG
jgi:membrane protease YdiL (CAAX protease family)